MFYYNIVTQQKTRAKRVCTISSVKLALIFGLLYVVWFLRCTTVQAWYMLWQFLLVTWLYWF